MCDEAVALAFPTHPFKKAERYDGAVGLGCSSADQHGEVNKYFVVR